MCSITSVLTQTPPLVLQGESTLLVLEPNFYGLHEGNAVETKGRSNLISLDSLSTVSRSRCWHGSRGMIVWLNLQKLCNSLQPYQL